MKNLVRWRQAFVGLRVVFLDSENTAGFVKWELLAVLTALLLLGLVTIPAIANTKPRADRVTCVNNLRLIGRACDMWANDHRDLTPWWVNPVEGGTYGHPFQNNAWFNYNAMSNELATPMILACPSDDQARVALDFSANPNGGFLNPSYRNNAVSYFIGLHAVSFSAPPASPSLSTADKALAGDRNLRVDRVGVMCSSRITVAAAIDVYAGSRSNAAWTNAIHGLTGNILVTDGHVEQTSNPRLVSTLMTPGYDESGGSVHLLMPR